MVYDTHYSFYQLQTIVDQSIFNLCSRRWKIAIKMKVLVSQTRLCSVTI